MASFYDAGWRKGPWTPQEDRLLVQYITHYGEGRWSSVSKCTGLKRSGKSCRLRWVNYLRPGLKKGHLSPQEEAIIIELHALWGNKWSTIARYLPGRTDNEIKNYWRTHFKPRKPCDQMKQQKSKESESPDSNINIFNDEFIEAVDDGATNIVTEIEFPTIEINQIARFPSIDKNQIARFPSIDKSQIVPMIDQENADYIPIDCYLWGGLWNLDDQTVEGDFMF